jgi:uncharacterized protein YkwD
MLEKKKLLISFVALNALLLSILSVIAVSPNEVSAAPTSIPIINTSSKSSVISSYKAYIAAAEPALGLNGANVSGCAAGNISSANSDYALTQVNWFRAMAGLSSLDPNVSLNDQAQSAALFTTRNQEFVGANSSGSSCNSTNATNGIQKGNRALTNNSASSKKNIALLMDDYEYSTGLGVSNRQSLLSPKATEAGYGYIPSSGNYFWGGSSFVWKQNLGSRTISTGGTAGGVSAGGESFVAWPNKGFTPYATTYSLWSLAGNGTNFSTASVSINKGGQVCSPTIVYKGNLPTSSDVESNIAWDMDKAGACSMPLDGATFTHSKPNADVPYQVTISGAKNSAGAALPNIVYTTTIINTAIVPSGVAVSGSSINENLSVGATIGTLSPVGANPGDDTWTYLVANSVPGSIDNALVEIEGNTLKVNGNINFEQPKTQLKVGVRITGSEGNTTTQLLTINVNDVAENPTGINTNVEYFAGTFNIGDTLATLAGVDPDAGSSFTYSLISGTGDANNNEFTISGSNLRAGASLTRGRKLIRLRVTDNTGRTFDKAVKFAVVPPGFKAVYRFFRTDNSTHFFTASATERDNVIANLPMFYNFESTTFFVKTPTSGSCPVGSTPLYRFFRADNSSHFYTPSEAEKNNVIANLSVYYKYEGPTMCVASANSSEFSTPVFRFFRKSSSSHFYTPSATERDNVNQNLSQFYTDEGTSFYVFN